MKTTLLLSTLAAGLIAAASSFAQTYPPTSYSDSQGYQETGTPGANWAGPSEQRGRTERR
jgi:hypothetical protein